MIYELIKDSVNQRLTKEELTNILGISDRAIRDQVSQEIKKGYPIRSSSREAGYTLFKTDSEIDYAIAENNSRIKELQLRNKGLAKVRKRMLELSGKQPSLF